MDEDPTWLSIVALIERSVADGVLHAGSKLPSQRLFADLLGVHVDTIGKAMQEALRRGLTVVCAGRGTFIAGRACVGAR